MEELDGTLKNTLKIFKNITLIHEAGMVMLEVRRRISISESDCIVLNKSLLLVAAVHSAALYCFVLVGS